MRRLEGRVAVVTGAASGIGQATSELLAQKGCHLALVDLNEDGLPDEGYGECVNDLDDDTTDTLFADPEIPLPGGHGFAYLVGWVDLVGEGGLGSTSAGLPREVDLPCP